MQLVAVKLQSRTRQAAKFQEVLTRHGCNIVVRLGLHEQAKGQCAEAGVIVLQVQSNAKAVQALVKDIKTIGQISVKTLSI